MWEIHCCVAVLLQGHARTEQCVFPGSRAVSKGAQSSCPSGGGMCDTNDSHAASVLQSQHQRLGHMACISETWMFLRVLLEQWLLQNRAAAVLTAGQEVRWRRT